VNIERYSQFFNSNKSTSSVNIWRLQDLLILSQGMTDKCSIRCDLFQSDIDCYARSGVVVNTLDCVVADDSNQSSMIKNKAIKHHLKLSTSGMLIKKSEENVSESGDVPKRSKLSARTRKSLWMQSSHQQHQVQFLRQISLRQCLLNLLAWIPILCPGLLPFESHFPLVLTMAGIVNWWYARSSHELY